MRRLFFMLCLVRLGSAPSLAEAAEDAKVRAGELARAANEFYSKRDYEGALALFERAHAIDPSPIARFNLGRTHQALGNLLRAAHFYQEFLDEFVGPPTSERRQIALAGLKEIDRRVGKLILRGAPEGASIKLDGAPLEDPSLTVIRVVSGEHDIEATLENRAPFRKVANVPAGATSTIDIDFSNPIDAELHPPPSPALAPPIETAEPQASIAGEWWFWTIVAGAAIAAGATVAVAIHSSTNGKPM
jgi:tetratricopeptide (TPR) repeat protein